MDLVGKTVLMLDAATPLAQAGVLRDGKWLAWAGERREAERSLFEAAARCLEEARVRMSEIDGFLFCEGPGSMLGIRITCMAIRSWQKMSAEVRPVFSYYSLAAAARLLVRGGQRSPFTMLSDARRGMWNVYRMDDRVERVESGALAKYPPPFFRIEELRKTACPVEAAEVVSDFSGAPGVFLEPRLARLNDAVEPYLPAPPDYTKWTAERHR